MKTNDQWFEPGDKVMRVAWADDLGLPYQVDDRAPGFGQVCCVQRFDETEHGNDIRLVGYPDWFWARCFRKVEDIQRCINACKPQQQPLTTP